MSPQQWNYPSNITAEIYKRGATEARKALSEAEQRRAQQSAPTETERVSSE